MPSTLVLVNLAIEGVVCMAGLIFGGWRERAAALIYGGAVLLAVLLKDFTQLPPMWRYLTPDSLCLLGFVVLCWKSPHPWPIWACGAQLMSVCISIAKGPFAQSTESRASSGSSSIRRWIRRPRARSGSRSGTGPGSLS